MRVLPGRQGAELQATIHNHSLSVLACTLLTGTVARGAARFGRGFGLRCCARRAEPLEDEHLSALYPWSIASIGQCSGAL